MSAETWSIRPYEPGDESQIVALFARAFGRPMTEAHWRWKVLGQPTPVNNVWLVVAGSQVIGQYACIPTRFWLDGQEQLVMVGVDAMVDPAYRRHGMWTALVTHAHEVWSAAGVAFALGLPNERWGSRRDALGWQSLFGLKWHIRPLQPLRLVAQRLRLPQAVAVPALAAVWNRFWTGRLNVDPTIELTSVQIAGAVFDEMWAAARLAGRDRPLISVVRDRAWVQWRFLDVPESDYHLLFARRGGKPVGYVAFTIRDTARGRLGTIADLFISDNAERFAKSLYSTLLALAIQDLISLNADAVAALAIPGSSLDQLLARAGFRLSWGTFDVRAVPFDPRWPAQRLMQPEGWFLSGSEFDAV